MTNLFLALFDIIFNSYREFPLKEHRSLVCWFCGGWFPEMCVFSICQRSRPQAL